MAWARIDDKIRSHPKVVRLADPAAAWLFVCSLSYAADYMTDGRIPAGSVGTLSGIPLKKPDRLAAKLVDAGLWETCENGDFLIHDFLEWNPSRDEIEAKKLAVSEQRSLAGRARARKGARGSGGRFAPKNNRSEGVGAGGEPSGAPADPLVGRSSLVTSERPAPYPSHTQTPSARGRSEGSASSSSQPLREGRDDDESRTEDPVDAEDEAVDVADGFEKPAAPRLRSELAAVLNDDQRYHAAKIVERSPEFRDLFPQQLAAYRRDHGDAVLTTALQRLAEADLSDVRKPAAYLKRVVSEIADEQPAATAAAEGGNP